MQFLHLNRALRTSRLNNYLVWPRVNILVFDMAHLKLLGLLIKETWTLNHAMSAHRAPNAVVASCLGPQNFKVEELPCLAKSEYSCL
jgi:hypothetical protein